MDNEMKNDKQNTIMTIATIAGKGFLGIFKMAFGVVFAIFKWVIEGREF